MFCCTIFRSNHHVHAKKNDRLLDQVERDKVADLVRVEGVIYLRRVLLNHTNSFWSPCTVSREENG